MIFSPDSPVDSPLWDATTMGLTTERRRALELLASDPHGPAEALMIAHGFRRKTLAGLVLAGS